MTFTLETVTTPARTGHILLKDRPQTTREVIECDGKLYCEVEGMTHDEAAKLVEDLNAGYRY
jgi:hypothetical protein